MADETTGTEGNADINPSQPHGSLGAPPQQGGGAPLSSAGEESTRDTPPPPAPGMQDDINKILAGVKLPERRTEAPAPQKQFDTALGAAAEAPLPPATPAPARRDDGIAAVHTLKGDLAEVVEENKISLVRAAALEQEKKRPEPLDQAPLPHTRSIGSIVAAICALVLLGSGALAGVYLMAQPGQQETLEPVDSIIFAESARTLPLDGQRSDAVRTALAQLRQNGSAKLGAITHIVPTLGSSATEHPASFAEFMSAMNAHPPDALIRALSSDFFLGFHTVDKNAALLVIPVVSYDHAFEAMLSWEKTMSADLDPLFTPVTPLVADASGEVHDRVFTDEVNRNFDIRALHNDAGEVVLYYSFPSRSILVIAESPYSFPEILSRLQAARRL